MSSDEHAHRELGALQVVVDDGEAGSPITVTLSGELDQAEFPRADAALQGALARSPSELVIDMRALWFLDSAGIRALLRAYHGAREQGVEYAILAGERGSRQMLKMAGLESLVREERGAGRPR